VHASPSYLAHNGTGPPPTTGWIVPHLKELLRIVGTKTEPVTHIDLLGVGFRDSEYTYLDDWGIPSGGDWYVALPIRIHLDLTFCV
jgi:hypothetical protein